MAGIGDEGALVLERLAEPLEHLVQGVAKSGDLVVARRYRQTAIGLRRRDLRRPRAHRLDRLQRRGGNPVGGERGEQERDRTAEQQQLREVGERLVAGLGRGADDDDLLAAPRLDRDRQQPRLVLPPGRRATVYV